MSGRNTNSSARGTGGLNAAGNPLDTLIVIPGQGTKEIVAIHWSFSALGAQYSTSDYLTSRIAVVAGVDLSQGLQANLVTGFPDQLAQFGGALVYDTQITGGVLSQAQGNGALPSHGRIPFDATSTEGKIQSQAGPLSILMTAPIGLIFGVPPSNVAGILVVQYANKYGPDTASQLQAPARPYRT